MIPVELLKAYGVYLSCAINSLTKARPAQWYSSHPSCLGAAQVRCL